MFDKLANIDLFVGKMVLQMYYRFTKDNNLCCQLTTPNSD